MENLVTIVCGKQSAQSTSGKIACYLAHLCMWVEKRDSTNLTNRNFGNRILCLWLSISFAEGVGSFSDSIRSSHRTSELDILGRLAWGNSFKSYSLQQNPTSTCVWLLCGLAIKPPTAAGHKTSREMFPLLLFPERECMELASFPPYMFGRLSEVTWAWGSFVGKFKSIKFNFFTRYRPLRHCFLLCQLNDIFKEILHFI